MNYRDEYNKWINDPSILETYREELKELNDEKEIEDRFYRELEFGTAGLRGVLGAGTNRMNEHTVGKATLGLARYLTKLKGKSKIAIGYDSRIKSDVFSKVSAQILANEGHEVFLFESLRPVPLLSFAVRELKCDAGIVITASHNPKQYNGFKVYSAYGGQVTDDEADLVLKEINSIREYSEIKLMDYTTAINKGNIKLIGEEVDSKYNKLMEELTIKKEMVKNHANELKIIYTPLHGSGLVPVSRLLTSLGYSNLNIVPEQREPNGNFPTAPYPNPENKDVFKLALDLNEKIDADIIFATDPDADRIGLIVKDKEGNNQVLSGNQTGMLLTYYMLNSLKEENKLPSNGAVIKTIVSTESVRKITDDFNIELMDVLTGFKYIGEKIEEFIETKEHTFLLGFEESYGYLVGTNVRDKDAVVTSMMVCEMALYYKLKGMTLYDALIEVYEKYGYFKEGIKSYTKEGKEGTSLIKKSLEYFRTLTLDEVLGSKVVKKLDYELREETDLVNNKKSKLLLPKSNVIKFMMADDSWFVIRPSGTEPKMKAYVAVKGSSLEDANKKQEELLTFVNEIVEKSFK